MPRKSPGSSRRARAAARNGAKYTAALHRNSASSSQTPKNRAAALDLDVSSPIVRLTREGSFAERLAAQQARFDRIGNGPASQIGAAVERLAAQQARFDSMVNGLAAQQAKFDRAVSRLGI